MGGLCFKSSSSNYEEETTNRSVRRTYSSAGSPCVGSEDYDTFSGTPNYSRGSESVRVSSPPTPGSVQSSQPDQSEKIMIVAAIDFGTTYSGYGFSYISDPEKILTNIWPSGNVKTPTVVLLNQHRQFDSFGEEARSKYMELINNGTYKDWYFFENFKMKLYAKKKPLELDVEIKDFLGRPMKAFDIFTMAIKYIRKHLLEALNDSRRDFVNIKGDTDIRWVITVPAIWNDLSKFFMRKAAVKAGISNEMLTLALEPEAASLFCKQKLGQSKLRRGCRYMVVDIGGGTTDITCHEIQDDDTLKEIHPPSGGDFGGTDVDNKFLSILTSIFGRDVMDIFKREHLDEYWEMLSDFQLKKRKFNGNGTVHMKFSIQLPSLFEETVDMKLSDALLQWPWYPGITFNQGKISIAEKHMREIFNVAITEIVQKVNELKEKVESIEHIILVGGFSESPYLKRVMQENFDNIYVLPKEASAAVLKGAVTYGHKAKAISARKSLYTFGIARLEQFNPDVHPESRKVRIDNYTFCDDVFNKHIEIGTVVRVDSTEEAKYHEYYPSTNNQNMAVLEVYKSEKRNPAYVDEEGCELVGYIKVNGINPRNDKWCELLVRLIFGGTELIVEVCDKNYKLIIRGSVSFFG